MTHYPTRTVKITSNGEQFSEMPMVGLGTFQLYRDFDKDDTPNDDNKNTSHNLENFILKSLKLGYRLFDLAECYKNSKQFSEFLGQCCKKLEIERSDIFIHGFTKSGDDGGAQGGNR